MEGPCNVRQCVVVVPAAIEREQSELHLAGVIHGFLAALDQRPQLRVQAVDEWWGRRIAHRHTDVERGTLGDDEMRRGREGDGEARRGVQINISAR